MTSTAKDILALLERGELLHLTDRSKVKVRDRRKKVAIIEALSGSQGLGLGKLLTLLPVARLRELCRQRGLDDGGREKLVLVTRLVGGDALTRPATDQLEPARDPLPEPEIAKGEPVPVEPAANTKHAEHSHFGEITSFIWSVADLLRGDYKQSEYGHVILPFTVLRRLDQVLEPTRDAVRKANKKFASSPDAVRERMLLRASGQTFYNISKLDFPTLLQDADNIAANLVGYVNGFSQNARDIIEHFRFEQQIERLDGSNLLFLVAQKFNTIDLHPDRVSNMEMGSIFEELIRRFAEASNETAGEHFTPREVIRFMVNLLFIEDDDALRKPGVVRTLYDPACGTGGMLSVAEDYLAELNPDARLEAFGQELNAESYAICKSDMMIKGQAADNIKFGNSFSEDGLPSLKVDYLLSNPPFGVDWTKAQQAVKGEHERLGHAGRFGPGLPRKNDGSLLFLMHMLSKMKPEDQGGSRLAIVFNGSPLFTGAAGSGESEIRRWIIENDWLEAIVVLPEKVFDLNIRTYVWLLTNRKAQHRRGKVQLINGEDYYQVSHAQRYLKHHEISEDNIQSLVNLYRTNDDHPDILFVQNEDLGYQRLRLGFPLRLNFQVSPERIARLEDEKAWQNLLKSKKKGMTQQKEVEESKALQKAVMGILAALDGTRLYKSRPEFVNALKIEATAQGVTIPRVIQRAILKALSERDDTAEICMKDGVSELDSGTRQFVDIALGVDVDTHMKQEIIPRLPGAQLIDVQIGFAVKRIDHLGFALRRELEGLRHQYENCQLVPLEQVCKSIKRRRRLSPKPDAENESAPLETKGRLRSLEIETDEQYLLPDYLAMFFSTEVGQRLLSRLPDGIARIQTDPHDLAQIVVPVPTLFQQRALLEAKAKIDDLAQLLSQVEAELAANPANIDAVQESIAPMLRALGQVSAADQVRELVRGGESKRTEFKETFSLDVRKQTKEVYIENSALKSVVAFLNSEGGDLLVGVADDGDICGVEPELAKFHKANSDKLLLHVKNRIKTRIGEQFYPLLDQRIVSVDGATILWVRCAMSETPVYLDDKSFFVRTNPATDQLEGRKQYEYIRRRFG